ncbi:GNAT family N-acetyltransferase [Tamlana sp. 2_MG-2023]|uniref:GNAT family N-acetyltransferase n=1 Tax=unclassified Tamlana TaxID=2614803 RepID=UPI0026E44083|nr:MULTISPECIES: GNAT family N-acetyltransferase [unclassified Tamlana]MDO6759262.1 GNAT family N-acetyltransferase [Tamlana sp. 2_MG-2023]MDO6790599.1 GNAT family N-acetyltransferase [Tamlana sp. 1_MG-2023]
MINFSLAEKISEFKTIASLAEIIWREHYIPMVGKAQVDYMLDKFQSAEAIKCQVESGYLYYMISYHNKTVGYFAILNEAEALFLSKFYVLSDFRGKSIGKNAMNFIEAKALEFRLNKIRLTVNINNRNTIKAYEKLGFKTIGPLVADIGNGFVMDDFEMVLRVKN